MAVGPVADGKRTTVPECGLMAPPICGDEMFADIAPTAARACCKIVNPSAASSRSARDAPMAVGDRCEGLRDAKLCDLSSFQVLRYSTIDSCRSMNQ